MDVATLSYQADAKPIEKVNEALEENVRVGSAAERQIIRWASAATDAAKKVANENTALTASVSALDSIYRKLIGTVTTLAAGVLAAFSLHTFIESTSEADSVQAQLAATLQSTQQVAGQTQDALNDVAEELKQVSVYGDEAVNSAQALLLTFTRLRGENFEKATKVAVDFAQAMKVDLSSAAWTLGRALENPIQGMNMLRRSGVNLSDSQKTTIKSLVDSGKGMEAQAMLLEILETRYAGSAKAARETLGGALKALGGYFGDAFEMGKESSEPLRLAIEDLITALKNPAFIAFIHVIGDVLFGVMQAAVKGATALADAVIYLSGNMEKLTPYIIAAGVALIRYFGPAMLSGIAYAFGALGAAGVAAIRSITVAAMANPFGALVLAISAVLVAAYAFRDEISDILGFDIVEAGKKGVNFIINSFTAVYEDIKFLWSNFPDIIGAAVIGAVNAMTEGVNKMISYVSEKLDWLIEKANSVAPSWAQIPKIGFEGGKGPIANPYADRLAQNNALHSARQKDRLAQDPLGDLSNWWNSTGDKKGAQHGPNQPVASPEFDPSDDKSKAAEAYKKIIDAADQYIAKQKLEEQALGMTALAAATLRNEQDLLNKANEADLKLSPAQTAELKAKAAAMAEAAEKTKQATIVFNAGRDADRFIRDQQSEREAMFMSAKQANILRKEREALNKATADGTVLLPEAEEKLRAYARATAIAENETTALKDAVDFAKTTFQDFFTEMIGGIRQGMSAWDAFAMAATKALNKVMDKLISMALDEGLNAVMDSLTSVFKSASGVGGSPAGSAAGKSSVASGGVGLPSTGSTGMLSGLFSRNPFQGSVPSDGSYGPQQPGFLNSESGLAMGDFGMGNVMGGVSALMGGFKAITAKNTEDMIGGIGQAVGGALMMIPTPWTMAAGAVISLASAVLPSLLGGGDKRTHSSTNANLIYGSDGFYTTGGAYGEGANSLASEGNLKDAGQGITEVFKLLGGVKDGSKVWQLALDSWTAQGKDWSYTSQSTHLTNPETGQRQAWRMNEDNMMDTGSAQLVIKSLLSGAVGPITDALTTALHAMESYAPSLEEAAANIQFVTKQYENLGKIMGPAQEALDTIATTFGEMTDKAKKLNLSLDPINEAETKARTRFAQDFIDSMVSPFQVQLRALADQREAALNSAEYIRDNVEGVYVDIDKITAYYTKMQLQMTKEFYEQSVGSIQDALDQLTYGSLSGTSPLTMLQGLEGTYNQTLADAQSGDTDAQNRVAQEGLDYVAFAKTYFGGNKQSQEIKDQVRGQLAGLAASILKDSGVVDVVDQMGIINAETDTRNRQLIEAQARSIDELKEQLALLTDQIKRSNANKYM